MPKNKLWLIVLAFIFVISIALLSLNLDSYAEKLTQIAALKLRPLGIELTFEKPQLHFTSIKSDRVGLTFPQAFVGLLFESVDISVSPISFLFFKPKISFLSQAYSGALSGTAEINPKDSSAQINISSRLIDLSLHPQIAALGLTGFLSISDSWLKIGPGQEPSADIHLYIKDGGKPDPTKVNLAAFGAPFSITAPAMPWFNFGLDASLHDKTIDNLEFSLASSLGSVTGRGTLWLSQRNLIEKISLSTAVALTADGKREFGTLLSLASNGLIKPDATEFKASFEGPSMRPQIVFSDIQ